MPVPPSIEEQREIVATFRSKVKLPNYNQLWLVRSVRPWSA